MKFNFILPILVILITVGFTTRQAKKKILFFGDSITQQGENPGGYIRQLDSVMQKKGQSNNYELMGEGIGGNKVYDLYLRLEDDVMSKTPDVVVIWIGVNDVWHKRSSGTGTDADKFEKFYNAIIRKLKEKNITVYLCTPAVIGERFDNTNELDGDLNKYSSIIRSIAQKNGCYLIDYRKDFLNYIRGNNPDNKDRGILTTDGVHLNATGNKFVAQLIYDTLATNGIIR